MYTWCGLIVYHSIFNNFSDSVWVIKNSLISRPEKVLIAAWWSGERTKILPRSSSNSTMSGWPFQEAECKGVSPSLF